MGTPNWGTPRPSTPGSVSKHPSSCTYATTATTAAAGLHVPSYGDDPPSYPSKSDYGDYSVASGLPMMSTAPPGVTSSAGKKQMGYLDQQQPMTGLAGRGDPASVRRNMNQSWGKKWGDE